MEIELIIVSILSIASTLCAIKAYKSFSKPKITKEYLWKEFESILSLKYDQKTVCKLLFLHNFVKIKDEGYSETYEDEYGYSYEEYVPVLYSDLSAKLITNILPNEDDFVINIIKIFHQRIDNCEHYESLVRELNSLKSYLASEVIDHDPLETKFKNLETRIQEQEEESNVRATSSINRT